MTHKQGSENEKSSQGRSNQFTELKIALVEHARRQQVHLTQIRKRTSDY